jgi:hypothetical protein
MPPPCNMGNSTNLGPAYGLGVWRVPTQVDTIGNLVTIAPGGKEGKVSRLRKSVLYFLTGIDFTPRHRPLGVRQHRLPIGIMGGADATTLATRQTVAVFMDEAVPVAVTG